MRYYFVQFIDEKERPCASYDTVESIEAAQELWSNIRLFEDGAHSAVVVDEFGDRVKALQTQSLV